MTRFLVRTDGHWTKSQNPAALNLWEIHFSRDLKDLLVHSFSPHHSSFYPHTHPLLWSRPIFFLVYLALCRLSFFPFWSIKPLFFFFTCYLVLKMRWLISVEVWSIYFVIFLEHFWYIAKSEIILLRWIVRANVSVTSSRNCTMLSCLHFNRWRCCQVYGPVAGSILKIFH